jgi:Ca2+-binding RTX toxin-like protein
MAQFLLQGAAFDFRDFNIHTIFEDLYSWQSFDNKLISFDSEDDPRFQGTHQATDGSVFWPGQDEFGLATRTLFLLGDQISFTEDWFPTAGTVTGLAFGFDANGEGDGLLGFGFSLSMSDLVALFDTPNTRDDAAVLRLMLAGNDRVFGTSGDDYVFGANGKDKLWGEEGDDTLLGGDGNDSLNGGKGNDSLVGGDHHDTLSAGIGTDKLYGGRGTDLLVGGTDSLKDVFVYKSHLESANSSARDVIQNFSAGVDDINLKAIDANSGVGGDQTFAYSGANAAAHSVWLVKAGGNTTVYADVNGDRTADFSIRLLGVTALSQLDFLL